MLRIFVKNSLTICLLPILAACANHVFVPSEQQWQQTPMDHGYDFLDQYILVADNTLLNAWLIPSVRQSRLGAIIYFHGNANNISYHIEQVSWLVDSGYDVLMVDYRGYGASEGDIDLHKTVDDVAYALAWFQRQYPDDTRQYVLGQSLGGSLAAYVLGTREDLAENIDAVILDAAFARYRQIMRDVMAAHWFTAMLRYPASLFMPSRYDPLPVIGNISPIPVLILHNKQDQVVDYQHALDLYAHAGEPKKLLNYTEPHIRGFREAHVREAVLQFLAESPGVSENSEN